MERFGFKDEDLTTSQHDKILLFLLHKQNSSKMLLDLKLIEKRNDMRFGLNCGHCFGGDCDWDWTNFCCHITKSKDPIYIDTQTQIINITKKLQEFKKHYDFEAGFLDLLNLQSEYAIMSGNYNVGFIDLVITINPSFEIYPDNCDLHPRFQVDILSIKSNKLFVEIKPQIRSIGELIRQINFYRSHIGADDPWIVVTSDLKAQEILKSQKIILYQLTDKTINEFFGD